MNGYEWSVRPELLAQDFSGYASAAEIRRQGMADLSQGIAKGIEATGDYFKQQGEKKKLLKESQTQIDAALKLFPELAPVLQGANDQIRDENIPLRDRVAAAESITGIINMGIGEMRNARNMLVEQQKLGLEQQYKAAQLGLQAEKVDIARQQAAKGPTPKFEIRRPTITSPTGEVFEGPELPYDESRGMYFDPKVRKYIADPNLIGTGQEYAPDSAMPTPTSQVMPSDGKFGFTYNTRDKLPASTANARQISLDFNAAANKNAKGIEIIIPNNASDIERALALDYVNKTKDFFASKGVDVPVRGVRTAAENKRGSANRFHTEPFFVNDAASRAAIESDPDGYAQVLASTIGKIPGAMFIPPHKSNDPGASANGINERDFAKSVLIPALERLSNQSSTAAVGTPQQQAEVARMIEQGAGMATAQNTPQGAMPTEPSMATQQPQLPQQAAPQWTPPPGFRPARPKGEAVMMTSEQVRNLASQGYKVDAVPTVEGGFMVSGVTAGGQTPRYTKTPEEELQSQRLTNLDKEQAELRSAGLSAAQDISQLKQITGLLDTSVKTGFGREVIMKAKRVVGADVANEEQFQALVGNEAMKNIALTKGAISDREMEYFKTVLSPNMGKTTAGNKKIIDFKIKYAERASKIAKTITKMQSEGKSPFEIQEQVSNIIESEPIVSNSDIDSTPANQAESDANFLEGFRSGE